MNFKQTLLGNYFIYLFIFRASLFVCFQLLFL